MSGLFVKLKYKCQQRQNKYAKSHKVFKSVLFHKHHLHSIKEMEGNTTLQHGCQSHSITQTNF